MVRNFFYPKARNGACENRSIWETPTSVGVLAAEPDGGFALFRLLAHERLVYLYVLGAAYPGFLDCLPGSRPVPRWNGASVERRNKFKVVRGVIEKEYCVRKRTPGTIVADGMA